MTQINSKDIEGGWSNWAIYVINQLKENNQDIKELNTKLNLLHTDIIDRINKSQLEVKKDADYSISGVSEKLAVDLNKSESRIKDLDKKIESLTEDVTSLKVKITIWASIGAAIAAAAIEIISKFIK
jgi:chromosome segregation ATPase